VLDAKIKDPKAILPSRLNAWLSKGLKEDAARRFNFHRKVLEKLIQAFTDQQLVTGISLLLSGYIKYGFYGYGPRNAHFTLGLFLSCLSSSSHLAGVVTLRRYLNEHPTTARLRVSLIICFALLLAVSMFVTNPLMPFYIPVLWEGPVGLPPMLCIIYVFWMAVMQCIEDWKKKLKSQIRRVWPLSWRRKLNRKVRAFIWFCLIGHPLEVFVIQISFALISLYFVLAQKFAPAWSDEFCSLNNSDENQWGFGQTLAMFLLLQPLVTALETYFGNPCPSNFSEWGIRELTVNNAEFKDERTKELALASNTTSTPTSLSDSPTPRKPSHALLHHRQLATWPPPRHLSGIQVITPRSAEFQTDHKMAWETEESPISDYDPISPYKFLRRADAEMNIGIHHKSPTTTAAPGTNNNITDPKTNEDFYPPSRIDTGRDSPISDYDTISPYRPPRERADAAEMNIGIHHQKPPTTAPPGSGIATEARETEPDESPISDYDDDPTTPYNFPRRADAEMGIGMQRAHKPLKDAPGSIAEARDDGESYTL